MQQHFHIMHGNDRQVEVVHQKYLQKHHHNIARDVKRIILLTCLSFLNSNSKVCGTSINQASPPPSYFVQQVV